MAPPEPSAEKKSDGLKHYRLSGYHKISAPTGGQGLSPGHSPLPSLYQKSFVAAPRDTGSFWRKWAFLRDWRWEISGVMLGIICTSLNVSILFAMDGKALDSWHLPIQPNSLVAVFSAVAKSALLVPIAECLSQLKWMYLDGGEPKTLNQLQVFDDASRGPWGAWVLLWRLRSKHRSLLACFGAVITILLLAFEPFTQQVITFPTRSAPVFGANGTTVSAMGLPNSSVNNTVAGSGGE